MKLEYVECQICKNKKSIRDCVPAETIRLSLVSLIKESYQGWNREGFICKKDLNVFRVKYIESLFDKEKTELSSIELHVIEHLKDQEIITSELYQKYNEQSNFWDNLSDRIAKFGGSWKFIISFIAFMLIWIITNIILVFYQKSFDPFPFIFLNLILSCVAAIQAPIIMMSQNRVESRDRYRAESEYQINLKAEIGIRGINEKLDHLIYKQWEKMSEVQKMQLDILEELNQLHKE